MMTMPFPRTHGHVRRPPLPQQEGLADGYGHLNCIHKVKPRLWAEAYPRSLDGQEERILNAPRARLSGQLSIFHDQHQEQSTTNSGGRRTAATGTMASCARDGT